MEAFPNKHHCHSLFAEAIRMGACMTSLKTHSEKCSCGSVEKQSQSVLSSSLEMLAKDGKYAVANTQE